MRTVQSSEAKTHFLRLLDEVEGGETLVITRRGVPVARLVPEVRAGSEDVERAIEEMREHGRKNGKVTVAELLEWRDEGRRF